MKVLFIRILLCKSRKQFWQTSHMKFVNSPILFCVKKSRFKVTIFWKNPQKVPLATQNAFSTTRPRDFCQNSVKNGSTIVSEKNILFPQKVLPDMLNTILPTLMELYCQISENFGTKPVNESEFMIFSQKNVIWFKMFSRQFHTFAKVFLWRVRNFVAHSAKTRLKLCFLKKITLRHSPKMILNFINFKERIICFKKILAHLQTSIAVSTMLPKLFCRKSENFPPVVQNWYNFLKSEKKLFPRQKKLPDLKNTVSIKVSKIFRKTSELFAQCPKTTMQNVSRKKFLHRDFHPDKWKAVLTNLPRNFWQNSKVFYYLKNKWEYSSCFKKTALNFLSGIKNAVLITLPKLSDWSPRKFRSKSSNDTRENDV